MDCVTWTKGMLMGLLCCLCYEVFNSLRPSDSTPWNSVNIASCNCFFACLVPSHYLELILPSCQILQNQVQLIHSGRVMHICVSNLTIIGSDSGLWPGRHQVVMIWTNAGILLICILGTNLREIVIEIHTFSLKKMHLKMSSARMAAILSRGRWVKCELRCSHLEQETSEISSTSDDPVYTHLYASTDLNGLTRWRRDRMTANSQMTFSNAFFWMKLHEFQSRIHWSLFPRVQLIIFQHWFR